MPKALGMIETKGLIGSIEATDAMLKAASVSLLKQEKIDGGLVSVLVEGDVGAVQASVEAGKAAAESVGEFIASHVIPHPDEGIGSILQKEPSVQSKKTKSKPKQVGKAENQEKPTTNNKANKKTQQSSTEQKNES